MSDPDKVLTQWLQREEQLFRALERLVLEDQIKKGFANEAALGEIGHTAVPAHNLLREATPRYLERQFLYRFCATKADGHLARTAIEDQGLAGCGPSRFSRRCPLPQSQYILGSANPIPRPRRNGEKRIANDDQRAPIDDYRPPVKPFDLTFTPREWAASPLALVQKPR